MIDVGHDRHDQGSLDGVPRRHRNQLDDRLVLDETTLTVLPGSVAELDGLIEVSRTSSSQRHQPVHRLRTRTSRMFGDILNHEPDLIRHVRLSQQFCDVDGRGSAWSFGARLAPTAAPLTARGWFVCGRGPAGVAARLVDHHAPAGRQRCRRAAGPESESRVRRLCWVSPPDGPLSPPPAGTVPRRGWEARSLSGHRRETARASALPRGRRCAPAG